MAALELLSADEISARMENVPGWSFESGEGGESGKGEIADRLKRDFEFANFQQAFGFMAGVACISERLFHHPEWSNVYNKVSIEITNHAAGGLTELDFTFAEKVNELLEAGG